MRSFVAVLLVTITSTFAYQVNAPGESQNWTTAGTNLLTWTRVDTDPLNFTAVLTNQACNQAAMPQGPQILNALVDGTLGQIACSPPSAGWPTGSGFRVNFATDAQNLDALLAQSNEFSIVAATSSGSSTATSGSSSTSQAATAATLTTATASTTSSDTSTTPTSTGGAVVGMNVETSFLTAVAAFVAFITTQF
ncbi:hypothetical protein K503DRAFT_795333 [Rhizopogon vinicolor AM-OR11-026]|uniref:Uncharacterized protein n=1 Tax=Rhizopogon vinicolor AM-OR11-026 TaxID=1314800 RepID=A0A1B7NHU3_9AGAM|nr:hypothetical protein K503DRAFT_795333 [Rhizopogon vinicolor AM-OR11-026]